jgi:hydroxymethylglutaryl-CoA lyase
MLPTAIQLIEVSPRDGLQNEPVHMSTTDKVALVHSAAGAGARRIEAVSFVNPKAVPQMADASEVMAALNQSDLRERGVSLAGLVLNFRGFERAVASGVDEVNLVVVASETFNQRNQGAAIAQTMQAVGQAVAGAKAEGLVATLTIGAAFGCPFEGEVDVSRVVDLASQAAALGVDEIALADTIGVGDPLSVETRLAAVRAVAGDIPLRVHFHNTRNTGLANAYAAWRMGVERMDASIGGIGGCPFAPAATGNIPTEDVAYMFARMGVETGLDQDALAATAIWLGEKLGPARIPGMMSKAGPFPARR